MLRACLILLLLLPLPLPKHEKTVARPLTCLRVAPEVKVCYLPDDPGKVDVYYCHPVTDQCLFLADRAYLQRMKLWPYDRWRFWQGSVP